jgi:hypothetical protein
MPVATIRINGLLAGDNSDTYRVTFEGKRTKLNEVLSKITSEIPEKKVPFFAINGVNVAEDSLINDGDIITVFHGGGRGIKR